MREVILECPVCWSNTNRLLQVPSPDTWGRKKMNRTTTFIIRLLLSAVFAVILSRVFFTSLSAIKVIGLGAALLCLAYVFEYARKKDKKGE